MSALRNRFAETFAKTKAEGRAALVTFVMAGDPDLSTCREVLLGLPAAGADVVELGMPFSDPMADGPIIQAAGQRALSQGHTMAQTLALARDFRALHPDIPLLLMGYFNPVFIYGVEAFARDAHAAGLDGVLIVDVPFEEERELRPALEAQGLALIPLVAPTTPAERMKTTLTHVKQGFVYTVAVTGITGGQSAEPSAVAPLIATLRQATTLPVALGFGVKTPEQAANLGRLADGVVVGSSLVQTLADTGSAARALAFVAQLRQGLNAEAGEKA